MALVRRKTGATGATGETRAEKMFKPTEPTLEIQEQSPGLTGGSINLGDGVKLASGETPGQQTARAVQTESLKRQQEFKENLSGLTNIMKVHVAAFKSMSERAGGSGRVKGVQNFLSGKLGELAPTLTGGLIPENPEVVAFKGNMRETALQLAKMTGTGGRPAIRLIEMLHETLANVGSTDQELSSQVRTSLLTSMGRMLGSKGINMTNEDMQTLSSVIDDIIATPSFNSGGFEEAGQVMTDKNGRKAIIKNGKIVMELS